MKKIHVYTFKKSCELLGIDYRILPDVSMLSKKDGAAIIALYKLSKISAASWLSFGVKIDWDNLNQLKYYAWFYLGSSGSGFRFRVCLCAYDLSTVGSRLVFPSRASAEKAAKLHKNLYKDLMLL